MRSRCPRHYGQRLALDDLVAGEVRRGDEAAAGVHGPLDRGRQRGLGEALAVEPVEERGQRRVGEPVALREQPAARRRDRGGLGRAGEDRLEDAQQVGLLVVDLDAASGEAPGGRGDRLELEAAEAAVGVQQAGQAAGHRHRAEAHVEALLGAGEPHDHLVEVQRAPVRRAAAPACRRRSRTAPPRRRACAPGGSHRRPGW